MNSKTYNRPPLLAALCILTFTGSSLSFFLFFLSAVFFEKSSELIIRYSSWYSVNAISPLYFTLFMVLSALSLAGAILMWKLRKSGFYLYSVSQIVMIFVPLFWIGGNSFSAVNAITTTVFVAGYFFALRKVNHVLKGN